MVVFHFTPEQIREKIDKNVRQEGDCLIWKPNGKVGDSGPVMKYRANGKYNGLTVQRHVYSQEHGHLTAADLIRADCRGGARCVEVSHLKKVSTVVDILERIERSVTKQENGCHTWNLKTFAENGRPIISRSSQGGTVYVQRYLYERFREKISEKTRIDLTCDAKDLNCCNIEHFKAVPATLGLTLEDDWNRMMTHVVRNEDGCLLWTASKTIKGYGLTTIRGDEKVLAHRASYMINKGVESIPGSIDGKAVNIRHTCRYRHCINPNHLLLGTASENMFDDKLRDRTLHTAKTLDGVLITEELASKIKLSKRKADDIGYQSMAKRAKVYNVSPSFVQSVDYGMSWSHLVNFYGKDHVEEKNRRREAGRLARIAGREKVWTDEEFEEAGKELYQMITKTSVNKRHPIDGDCWEFTGSKNGEYGKLVRHDKPIGAHVLSCEIKNKRHIEDGEVTRHLCGNKSCLRPSHLRFGTYSENARDEFGEGSTRSLLNPSKVRLIRESTKTDRQLAEEFGVTHHTIYHARTKKTWKHVIDN